MLRWIHKISLTNILRWLLFLLFFSNSRQEVHVWPNQWSTCLAQAIVRLMHRNPQTALAQSKHAYSIFDPRCSHSTAQGQWQFRKFTHVSPHYKFQNKTKSKPTLCCVPGLRSWAVCSRRESRASSFSGKWLSPNSLYFFSFISFSDFLYSVNLELEFQVQKLLEEIVNGGATDPFACFALGDWTSSQHSVSYCAGIGFASGWFSGKLKGKIKFPVWLFRVVHAVCGLWGKEEND